ncbi:LOW QUALITY PROTEIN: uncharacterized protein LOC121368688 [Gigantopelta aegis]|uniref:LOW QUALITY PROTEIN: uncharacterized protein LOC121368688 n=1 Tax=Gigantopelta aegis TaxID=1735272 RepID=UPI001B88BECD|nr:LOW QUALITY PROTEIN: uncharacterized protein LOC121368688 [Gigantopelta aegis]
MERFAVNNWAYSCNGRGTGDLRVTILEGVNHIMVASVHVTRIRIRKMKTVTSVRESATAKSRHKNNAGQRTGHAKNVKKDTTVANAPNLAARIFHVFSSMLHSHLFLEQTMVLAWGMLRSSGIIMHMQKRIYESRRTRPHQVRSILATFVDKTDNSNPHHIYINTSATNTGIVSGTAHVFVELLNGTHDHVQDIALNSGASCRDHINNTKPSHMMECQIALNVSHSLQNGQRLCTQFEISSGGFFKYFDFGKTPNGTEIFTRQTKNKTLCLNYDNVKPKHCLSNQTSPCNKLLIGLNSRITKTKNLSILLGDGWVDAWPKGGSPKHASGILKFILEVHEVKTKGKVLEVDKGSLYPPLKDEILVSMDHSISFVLPKAPALYCTMLEIHDVAGNVRFARRFVLFDNESKIEIKNRNPLRVSTASKITGYKWQVFHGLICLNWNDRYYNSYYINNNLLAPINPDVANEITGVYDQQTGKLPVNGTKSIHGLTGFIYSYSLNNGSFTPEKYVYDFEKESVCFNFSLSDGDTYVFKITAEDVMENRLCENVTVHIDRTVPYINNMWLVRGANKELYVHHSTDLSHMVLELEATDPHSGILSMEWFLGTQYNTSDLGHEALSIIKLPVNIQGRGKTCWNCMLKLTLSIIYFQKNCQDDHYCYCPSVGACAYFNYTVTLNRLVHNNKNIGKHNREYYFTLIATNVAQLKSFYHLDILVDASPPVAGVVLEGPPEGPDIDYTSEDHVYINIHGFIDHESGIRLYHVALAERCLTLSELTNTGYANTSIIHKTVNTIIKLSFPSNGLFYSSVVAFNNAMEPSNVICSDGITKDTTPPMLIDMILKKGQMHRGLWCKNAKAWYVDRNMTSRELQQTPACQMKCKNQESLDYVNVLPKANAITDNDTSNDLCTTLSVLNDESVIYLPSDKIYLKWKTNEPESQIRDYVIGIGDDKSQTDAPSVRSYQSTHGKESFHHLHSGLTSTSIFYIFLKTTNKAGLTSVVVLGPAMIDETPPQVTDKLNVTIIKNRVFVTWTNDSIKDPEETNNQFTVLYRIGVGDSYLTAILQTPKRVLQRCRMDGFAGCVQYPLNTLQKHDSEQSLPFFFELYIYNTAGHFTLVNTETFRLPSRFPPGNATVFDINPLHQETQADIDFHNASQQACVYWTGFYHHHNVTFYVGIGQQPNFDDVLTFVKVQQTPVCFKSSALNSNKKYFMSVKAECSGGTTVSSSDGFMIINDSNGQYTIDVYDGDGCHKSVSTGDFIPLVKDNQLYGFRVEHLMPGIEHRLFITNVHLSFVTTNISSPNAIIVSKDVNGYSISFIPTVSDTELFLNKPVSISIALHGHHQVCIPMDVYSYQDISICAKVFCTSASSDIFCKPVKLAQDIHNYKPYILYDIDSNDVNFERALTLIKSQYLDKDSMNFVHRKEINFATSDMLIGGVLTNTANRNVSWYLMTNNYLPQDCSSDKTCISNLQTVGGVVNFRKIYLQNRKLYYICAHVQASKVKREFSTQKLDSFAGCSNGFVVDDEPPESGNVIIIGQNNGFVTDGSALTITWNSFTDVEKYVNIPFESGIAGYAFALGKEPLCCGSSFFESGLLHLMVYENKLDYVTNQAGLFTVQHTPPFMMDESAPDIGIVIDGLDFEKFLYLLCSFKDVDYQENTTIYHCYWSGFKDAHSGIGSYKVGLGSDRFEANVEPLVSVGLRTSMYTCHSIKQTPLLHSIFIYLVLISYSKYFTWNMPFIPGERYFVIVEACNAAGLCSVGSSDGLTMDNTPPTIGRVFAGQKQNHENYVGHMSTLSGHWLGFEDPETDIVKFEWCLGYEQYKWYSFTEYKQFQSPPIIVDSTAPHIRRGQTVMDSDKTCGIDYDFMTRSSLITACWGRVFQDSQSGIDSYVIQMGSSPHGSDAIKPQDVGMTTNYSVSQNLLKAGTKYYVTVKAINKAGLYSVAFSDGFVIDDEPPLTGVVFNTAEHVNQAAQSSLSSFGVSWRGFQDHHSAIVNYQVAVYKTTDVLSKLFQVNTGFKNSIALSNVSFVQGKRYQASVTAVDSAGHVSKTIMSPPILVDSSPPFGFECSHFSDITLNITWINKPKSNKTLQTSNIKGSIDVSKQLYFKIRVTKPFQTEYLFSEMNIFFKVGDAFVPTQFLLTDNATRIEAHHYFIAPKSGSLDVEILTEQADLISETDVFMFSCDEIKQTVDYRALTVQQIMPSLVSISAGVSDPESDLMRIKIGAGTTKGGFQIRPLKSTFLHFDELIETNIPHGTPVFVTVTAENSAGLVSVFQSDPLIIDHTPPSISKTAVSLVYSSDGNYKMTVTADVTWTVRDEESGVKSCWCALGYKPLSKHIQPWTLAPEITNCRLNVVNASHHQEIYASLKCFNQIELHSAVSVGPRIVLLQPPSAQKGKVMFILSNESPESTVRPPAQLDTKHLQMAWVNLGDDHNIKTFRYRITAGGVPITQWKNTSLNYAELDVDLHDGQTCTAEVMAVDTRDQHSDVIAGALVVDSRPPILTGSTITAQWREGTVYLDWGRVFFHQRSALVYSIAVGSRNGYTDLLHDLEMHVTSVTVNVDSSVKSVYVVIKATADNGEFVIYSTYASRQ